MSECKLYNLKPKYKNMIHMIDRWDNILENGKQVQHNSTMSFEWGTFQLEITEKCKNELLKQDRIIINDIPCDDYTLSLNHGLELSGKIINSYKYTEEELKEIHRLLYFDIRDTESYDPNSIKYVLHEILRENKWRHNKSIYSIKSGGCIIELVPEDNVLANEEIETTNPNGSNSYLYKLKNAYKKTIYETELWNINLKNEKHVQYEINTFFNWGTFKVNLIDKEKNELLLKQDKIVLSDISDCIFYELNDTCDSNEKLVNEDKYTEEELKEIHRLLYLDKEDKDSYGPGCDDNIKGSILEANGWFMDNTIYGIDSGGCTLEIMSEFIRDDNVYSSHFI